MIGKPSSLAHALVVAVALGSSACGGKGGKDPQVPQAGVVDPSAGGRTPAVVSTPSGQQFGVTDQPSGGGDPANWPPMSAAARASYDAGMAAFQVGDMLGAKTQFEKATQTDAQAFRAFYSLGVVKERLGDRSGALSSYQKAIGIVDDYEPAIVAYGLLLARTGSASEADGFLGRHRAKMAKSAAVDAALAEVKSIQNDSAAAQRLAQEALKKNPNYRPAMVVLARDHYRTRRLDLALEALRGILDGYGPENPPRDKDNAEALLIRALILREQGRHKAAKTDFKRALELRPDFVEASVNLSRYLLEAGDATAAAPMLESALKYDKTNLVAQLNLGDAYRLLGKTAEAKNLLEGVLRQDSTLAQAHYNLGLLYLFSSTVPGLSPKDAVAKAIDEFERFKQKRPRPKPGQSDDTDELITRAKNKKSIMEAQEAEKNAPPPPPEPPPPAEGGGGDSSGALPPEGG